MSLVLSDQHGYRLVLRRSKLVLDGESVGVRFDILFRGERIIAFDGSGGSMNCLMTLLNNKLIDAKLSLAIEDGGNIQCCVKDGFLVSGNEEKVYEVDSKWSDVSFKDPITMYYYGLIQNNIIVPALIGDIKNVASSYSLYDINKSQYLGVEMIVSRLFSSGLHIGKRVSLVQDDKLLIAFEGNDSTINLIINNINDEFRIRHWGLKVRDGAKIQGVLRDGIFKQSGVALDTVNVGFGENTIKSPTRNYSLYKDMIIKNVFDVVSQRVSTVAEVDTPFSKSDYLGVFVKEISEGLFRYSDKFGEPYSVYKDAMQGLNCGARAYLQGQREQSKKVVVECYFATVYDYLSFVYNSSILLRRPFIIDRTIVASARVPVSGKSTKGMVKYKFTSSSLKQFMSTVCKMWGIQESALQCTAENLRLFGENEYGVLSCVVLKDSLVRCYCLKSSFSAKNLQEFKD